VSCSSEIVCVVSLGDMKLGSRVGAGSNSCDALDDVYAAKPIVISDTIENRTTNCTLGPVLYRWTNAALDLYSTMVT
jgi:hypothetical protein